MILYSNNIYATQYTEAWNARNTITAKRDTSRKKGEHFEKKYAQKNNIDTFISILGIFLLIVGFYVGSKYSLRDSSDPVKLSFENIGKLATQSAHEIHD